MFFSSLKNEAASFGASVLDRDQHERFDQLLQDDLAGHCLRYLHYRPQIQLINRCADRDGRMQRGLLCDCWEVLIELLHLDERSPTKIAEACVPEIGVGNCLIATVQIKPRSQFVTKALVLGKPMLARRSDRFFV